MEEWKDIDGYKGFHRSHNGKIYPVHHAYGFMWKYKQI